MILTEYNEKLHNKTLKEEGIEIGEKRGIEQTITLANTVFKLYRKGRSYEEIARIIGISIEQIRKMLD